MMQLSKTGLIVLIFLVTGMACTASADPAVSFSPSSVTIAPDGTTQATLLLSDAPNGLAGYDLVLNFPPSVVTVTDAAFPSWATLNRKTPETSSMTLRGVDLTRKVQSGTTSIELATVTMKGVAAGTGTVTISGLDLDADGGAGITATAGSLSVMVDAGASSDKTTATPVPTVTANGTVTPTPTPPSYEAALAVSTPAPPVPVEAHAATTLSHTPDGKTLVTTTTSPVGSGPQPSSTITINEGTTALTQSGLPLSSVYIAPAAADQYTVPSSGQYKVTNQVVQCGPPGATFNPPVTLSFTLTETQWADAVAKAGGNTASLSVMYYDPTTNIWTSIPTAIDPTSRTLTARVAHFSIYGVLIDQTDRISSGLPLFSPPLSDEPEMTVAATPTKGKTSASVAQQKSSSPQTTRKASLHLLTPAAALVMLVASASVLRGRRS